MQIHTTKERKIKIEGTLYAYIWQAQNIRLDEQFILQ